MVRPTHHYWAHEQHKTKAKRKQELKTFDNLVFGLSFVYPLSGIPQAISVWHGDGKASALTWILLTSFGFVSLAYGIIHRIKPMIVTNVIWSFIDIAIIIGILRS
jgi:hypothetical protein